eukprot:4734618-Heterocapsa_arctica.AAC.1
MAMQASLKLSSRLSWRSARASVADLASLVPTTTRWCIWCISSLWSFMWRSVNDSWLAIQVDVADDLCVVGVG